MSSPDRSSRSSPCTRSLLAAFLSGLILLAAACAATRAAPRQPQDPAGDEADPAETMATPTEKQVEDLQYHASILQNPANDRATRTGAAQRLLRMDLPEANAVLDAALRSGDSSLMWPVIEALAAEGEPAPGVREGAIQALRTAPRETLDELAIIVARYEQEAFQEVSNLALDRQLPIAERLGPVHALASFSTRESVDRLMELADPARGEDPTIRDAALDSVRRLAPADLGDDYEQWRAWWSTARQISRVEWAREVVRQYQDRAAELERLHGGLAQRYVNLLRELYLALPLPGQLQRLPIDLEDELPSVRAFALGRIARLLRDSVQIPDPVREMVISRMDDAVPALRRDAAQLLYELDEPSLAQRIAQRLPTERDREVILAYLGHLKDRTTAEALPSILAWLTDEELGGAAAEALWTLLRTGDLSEESLATARVAVCGAMTGRPTPKICRLAAYIVEGEEEQNLEAMLDDDDPALRAAVAEGLCARGRWQPLREKADDEIIYPWALRALAEGPAELEVFRVLIDLPPPPQMIEQWAEAVRALSGRLDPARLLEADDALAAVAYADTPLRAALLQRAAQLPPDALSLEDRIRLLERLAPMLIELGEAPRAFTLLDQLGSGAGSPGLEEIKFRAALYSGHYDAAGQIRENGLAWLEILPQLAERDQDLAAALRDEIARRFAARLADDPDFKAAFDATAARLAPASPTREDDEATP
jgi:hypothetical protein